MQSFGSGLQTTGGIGLEPLHELGLHMECYSGKLALGLMHRGVAKPGYARAQAQSLHILNELTIHTHNIDHGYLESTKINCDQILENSSKSHMKSNVFLHVFNDISTCVFMEYFLHSFSNLSIKFLVVL